MSDNGNLQFPAAKRNQEYLHYYARSHQHVYSEPDLRRQPDEQLGVHCILVRDLTDAMYNPRSRLYVSHAQGTTELVIDYIEKYWCPTVLSSDLVKALKP